MDALTMSFVELLAYAGGDIDLLFTYLTDFFGSAETARQAIIVEDVSL